MYLGRYARLKEQEGVRIIEKKMFTKQTKRLTWLSHSLEEV